MPRTKRTQKAKAKVVKDVLTTESKHIETLLRELDKSEARSIAKLERDWENRERSIQLAYLNIAASLTPAQLDATVEEICSGEFQNPALANLFSSQSILALGNATAITTISRTASSKPNLRNSRARNKRSTSCSGKDEGYKTSSGSSNTDAGGDRTTQRRSRSAATGERNFGRKNARFVTPLNNRHLSAGGFITPKCKPNSAHIILRRPKLGEEIWSNQGSPLLVGPVTSEQRVSVNIPLRDGNCMALLPEPCRTTSDMPDLDKNTKQQLAIMRDNIVKICKANKI